MVVIEPPDPEHQPDAPQDQPDAPEDEGPGKFDAWRRRSAVGGIVTGMALGLQDIFYPTDREPVITAEAPGDPPDANQRMRVILDPDDPTKSVALLPEAPPPDHPASTGEPSSTEDPSSPHDPD